jgi:hypothetical protein
MSAVYRYLRGVDPTTGEADTDRRLKLLGQLDDAAKECMEPTPCMPGSSARRSWPPRTQS